IPPFSAELFVYKFDAFNIINFRTSLFKIELLLNIICPLPIFILYPFASITFYTYLILTFNVPLVLILFESLICSISLLDIASVNCWLVVTVTADPWIVSMGAELLW